MSSGSQDRGRRQSSIPPEVPRRPLIVPMSSLADISPFPAVVPASVHPTRHGANSGIPGVREIHKNAWLKRHHTSYDKKGAPFVRRSEKWWVVFCVHDDVEALLEFYTEPKLAAVHKPTSRIGLNTCLHVSPSIVGQDNEYEFAVTLPSQVIRLAAADWDQMLEWVESLQGKLREMNVLSPKDNFYSKLPESKNYALGFPTHGSTRDPNSPLPAPPPAPNGNASTAIASVHPSENVEVNGVNHGVPTVTRSEIHRTSVLQTNRLLESFISASVYVQSPSASFLRDGSSSDSGNGSAGSVISIDPSTSPQPGGGGARLMSSTAVLESRQLPSTSVLVSNCNSTLVQIGFENPPAQEPTSSSPEPVTTQLATDCLSNGTTCQKLSRQRPLSRKLKTDLGISFETLLLRLPANEPVSSSSFVRQLSAPIQQNSQPSSADSAYGSNVYEPIFTPADTPSIENGAAATTNNNLESYSKVLSPPLIPRRNSSMKRLQRRMQLQNNEIRQSDTSQEIVGSRSATRTEVSEDEALFLGPETADTSVAIQEVHPLEGMIGIQCGEYRVASRSESQGNSPKSSSAPSTDCSAAAGPSLAHIPLKESQVLRLKSEINHAAGVRIVLRKKDCLDTIAFVDYLGAVWVAGWKQHEHPVLYYAFHIGDQVVKVCGEKVQSAEDTRRAIKKTSSTQVQFVIRRLPFGKVFVLKRKVDGEPIGLVAAGAEITEVIPHSLAAAEGVQAKGTSADGQSQCSWTLTEVNNRPLSLLARENEVRERLNALGKEISILVQPSDFVKHLKKQLKTVKGFKDYLVV